jgi:hypothetical protein
MLLHRFQKIYLAGVVLAMGLVLLGRLLAPAEKATGLLAAVGILVVYGLAGWFAPPKIDKSNPALLSAAVWFGLVAGLIFAGEIVLEYILLPKDNTLYGLVEFGAVFLVYFLSGLRSSLRTKRIRDGVLAAVCTAAISTLVWCIVLLGVFYLFRGTPQQTQVFQAEGNYADFARSGLQDFNTFILEDFMGAIFYHSLLGPLSALILGTVAGLFSKGLARISSH